MELFNVCICLNVFVFAGAQALSCVHVLIVCDIETSVICNNVTEMILPVTLQDTNSSLTLNVSVMVGLENFENGLELLTKRIEIENTSFLIGFGDLFAVNVVAVVAKDFGIPFLQYSTTKQRKPVSNNESDETVL